MKYKHSAVGGTFDHLHEGHKYIIDFALEHAETVSIAIATTKLYEHKQFNKTIEHFSYRKQALEDYLHSKKALSRVNFSELNDIYGSTLTDNSLDSIVVTAETEPNAVRINEERKKKGLAPLALLTCPLVKGDDNEIIRSTNIRGGIINRAGESYASLFTHDILYLPKALRKELRKPLSNPILRENDFKTAKAAANTLKNSPVLSIGVGDIVNKTLIEVGFTPDIQIIDFKTRRQDIQPDTVNIQEPRYQNEAGTLVRSTIIQLNTTIRKFMRNKVKQTLVIDGEEDLLTLPAILLSPLHTYIVYGQFEQGIVIIEVTEDLKEKIRKIINQFITTPQ